MDDEKECPCNSHGSDSYKDYKLSETQKMQLKENFPDILDVIHCMHKFIKKQRTKIRKLKLKLKNCATKDIGIQTDDVTDKDVPKTISEEIKEVAELAMQKTGFVYEKTSGLYYDYNSGYYYNAELGLYYDGNTGTYMTYNTETQCYDFHSQVDVSSNNATDEVKEESHSRNKRKKNHQKKLKGYKRERSSKENFELEEGECSNSSHTESLQDSSDEKCDFEHADIARGWPPCMRIIIKSTEVPKIKEGALYLITYEGGTLGREGDHAIIIPDINISKHHLKFNFDKNTSQYVVTDLGSRNGTFLNGKRISASKQESEPMEVVHGSQVQIGSTVLLCHIHSGNETCGHCEPGLLQTATEEPLNECSLKQDMNKQHKDELRKLRKKFGIGWLDSNTVQLAAGYTDRAQVRRKTVGSHNEHEKTQAASVDQAIGSENKGFKLLSKMGWSEGQSLGKEGTGVLNPVELKPTMGTTGMGYTNNPEGGTIEILEKESIWTKTQKRYQNLPELESPTECSTEFH